MGESEPIDGRRKRGERTRRTVAHKAAELASVQGLDGLTLGQLADALQLSKSSIQAAYTSKEDLQLATVAAATQIFLQNVIAPSLAQPEGLPRLHSLVGNWISYISQRVLPGGCFMGATLAEFDSKPGPVRDQLALARRQWLTLIERQITKAQKNGKLPSAPSAPELAFEIDALLAAANVARNLHDDELALTMAKSLIEFRLGEQTQT
jgi:AcrR family transcriptional regulator